MKKLWLVRCGTWSFGGQRKIEIKKNSRYEAASQHHWEIIRIKKSFIPQCFIEALSRTRDETLYPAGIQWMEGRIADSSTRFSLNTDSTAL